MNIGLLIIRLIVGLTLVAHGAQKLFGRLGGGGLAGTGEMLEKIGLRPGKPYALLAGLTEAGGGLMLAAGLLTPVASAAIIAVMAVAIEVAHASKGFFAHKRSLSQRRSPHLQTTTASFAPASTACPSCACNSATTPAFGLLSSFSIFIASTTTRGWPSTT